MFAGAAQRLFQCRAAISRLRRPRPNLGAFTIPTEIILIIASYLTKSSVISLGLTCRTLYCYCFPQHLHLDAVELEEVLLLLEKDIANVYFCHFCSKLHRWRTSWFWNQWSWGSEHLPCGAQLLATFLRISSTCVVPYNLARLIMNRHFYGIAHGITLRNIEGQVNFHYRSNRVAEHQSTHARIVEDELLLSTVTTMSQSQGDSKALRDYVESLGRRACHHLTFHKGSSDYIPRQLPELAKSKDAPCCFAPCDQSFGSCPFCLTDYSVEIIWRGSRKGYIIKVFVYQQLGDCRSPFDWTWRSMAQWNTTRKLRTAHPIEYRPGFVRDKWLKAEGINGVTQAEWVEVPRLARQREC